MTSGARTFLLWCGRDMTDSFDEWFDATVLDLDAEAVRGRVVPAASASSQPVMASRVEAPAGPWLP